MDLIKEVNAQSIIIVVVGLFLAAEKVANVYVKLKNKSQNKPKNQLYDLLKDYLEKQIEGQKEIRLEQVKISEKITDTHGMTYRDHKKIGVIEDNVKIISSEAVNDSRITEEIKNNVNNKMEKFNDTLVNVKDSITKITYKLEGVK